MFSGGMEKQHRALMGYEPLFMIASGKEVTYDYSFSFYIHHLLIRNRHNKYIYSRWVRLIHNFHDFHKG